MSVENKNIGLFSILYHNRQKDFKTFNSDHFKSLLLCRNLHYFMYVYVYIEVLKKIFKYWEKEFQSIRYGTFIQIKLKSFNTCDTKLFIKT